MGVTLALHPEGEKGEAPVRLLMGRSRRGQSTTALRVWCDKEPLMWTNRKQLWPLFTLPWTLIWPWSAKCISLAIISFLTTVSAAGLLWCGINKVCLTTQRAMLVHLPQTLHKNCSNLVCNSYTLLLCHCTSWKNMLSSECSRDSNEYIYLYVLFFYWSFCTRISSIIQKLNLQGFISKLSELS